MRRFLAREEALPSDKVVSFGLSEAIYSVRPLVGRAGAIFDTGGMKLYGALAAQRLPSLAAKGAQVYHYRSGFGGASVAVARRLGMVTICDHSIVHPCFVESLIENYGNLEVKPPILPSVAIERHFLSDFKGADYFLVNSDFVKETFLRLGYAPDRVHVIYQGIDARFARELPPRESRVPGRLRLLAPAFSLRKGAPTLVAALSHLEDVDWELLITRPPEVDVAVKFRSFLENPRVRILNPDRRELGRLMTQTDVVVFPTYAEGSARVIFEAMAAGSYVITTPNAGSVLASGPGGELVPAGDDKALRDAIRRVSIMLDALTAGAQANKTLIADHYNQAQYGCRLAALYDLVLSTGTDSA